MPPLCKPGPGFPLPFSASSTSAWGSWLSGRDRARWHGSTQSFSFVFFRFPYCTWISTRACRFVRVSVRSEQAAYVGHRSRRAKLAEQHSMSRSFRTPPTTLGVASTMPGAGDDVDRSDALPHRGSTVTRQPAGCGDPAQSGCPCSAAEMRSLRLRAYRRARRFPATAG